MQRHITHAFAASLLLALPAAARADIVLSSNDGHTVQDDQKHLVAPKDMHPDTISIIDVAHYPPRITATVDVPGSVVGPPTAAWVAKDESWAIVTSATKADAQAKDGIAPDDRVSVIDLTSKPPKITQSLTAGLGATTVRLSPDGKLALVANRTEGTVSVFSVADKTLTAVGKVDLGNKASLPSGIVFSPRRPACAADTWRRQHGERAEHRWHQGHRRSAAAHHGHGALHDGQQRRRHARRRVEHGPR